MKRRPKRAPVLAVFKVILLTICLNVVASSAAMAAGVGYAVGAGGASVGLSSLTIYFAAPLTLKGKTYDIKKTPIPMECTVRPDTFSSRYKLVIAKAPKEIKQTAYVTVLTGFFAGVFKGSRDVISKFPHPIICIIQSKRISVHDRVYLSKGRTWNRDRNVVIRRHEAIVFVNTSDYFEVVAPRRRLPPPPPGQKTLCVIYFAEGSYAIPTDSTAAAKLKVCAEKIVKLDDNAVTIVGSTDDLDTAQYNLKLSLERAEATEVVLQVDLAALHAKPVSFVLKGEGISTHYVTLAANRRAVVTGGHAK